MFGLAVDLDENVSRRMVEWFLVWSLNFSGSVALYAVHDAFDEFAHPSFWDSILIYFVVKQFAWVRAFITIHCFQPAFVVLSFCNVPHKVCS